ncbi:AtpZ/AtpI family protein [Nubsella zeaxanthinifaciens]|uniref:AtpZ/AtpI family protein n=1 Tax=Nubsella zeaxanthinifaciens TaxID=392412 RepID=UPI003D0699BC
MDNQSKPSSNFIKYTAVGFQMLVTIGLFAFIGYKIDQHQHNENYIFTAILGLIGTAASLYQVVKALNKEK